MPLVQQWGRYIDITRDAAGGWNPLGEPGNLDLVSLAAAGRPVVWLLDLEIIDVATGRPPEWTVVTLPPPPGWAGGFRISFGAGGDVREHIFGAGIHAVIGSAIRIRVVPQIPSGIPSRYRFAAHCTWTLSVPPSYEWIL